MKNDAHHHHGSHGHHGHVDDASNGTEVQPTDKPHVDPVCGMNVGSNPEKAIEFDGQAYHFCSSRCIDKFRGDSQAYTGPKTLGKEAAPAMAEGTVYTCPMHPEIRQPARGACPKCGMALEPEVPTLEDKENPELADFRRRFWWRPICQNNACRSNNYHQPLPEERDTGPDAGLPCPGYPVALMEPPALWPQAFLPAGV